MAQVADAVVPAVPLGDSPWPGGPAWKYQSLAPEQVRWYYLRTPLSLKGYYEQDILHRAHIQRFCSADSLSLEKAFAQQREELEKLWWEEQAELGARTLPGLQGPSSPPIPDAEAASADWQDYFLGQGAGDEVGLPVRSGLYEADLRQRRLKACYWPEPSRRILRGTWFLEKAPDWVVLKEATADELEEAYRSAVWVRPGAGRAAAERQGVRVELRTLTNEAKGWFALFFAPDEAYLCRDDSLSWLSRKLAPGGSAAPGARLRRGWQPPPAGAAVQEAGDAVAEAADEAAAGRPVAKLLLVVHGIGQNLAGSNIAGDAAAVRAGLAAAAGELPERERRAGRVEALPVQWRKHLALDADALADALMPPGMRSLRAMLHSTAVEVLLYLTPLHCQDMLDALVDSLNTQFTRFQRRNPGFQGSVSILAHSLGSVLCYDVLCCQPRLFAALPAQQQAGATQEDASQPSPDPEPEALFKEEEERPEAAGVSLGTELEALRLENARLRAELADARRAGGGDRPDEAADPNAAAVRVKPLAFAVDCLVAAGSPLGIFLTLRRVNPNKGRGLGTPAAARLMPAGAAACGDGLPAVRRLYNLYHPFDPVGFRLEPLITPGAEKRRPVYAAYAKGGRRLHVGLTELGEDVSAAMSAGAARATSLLQHGLSSLKLTGRTGSAKNLEAREPSAVETRLDEAEEAEEAGVARASHGTDSAVWRLTDGRADAASNAARSARGRLDFVLQSGNVENPWLSAMSSHFAYWASADTALFVLRALYGHDVRAGPPKEPPPAPEPSRGPASPPPVASPPAPSPAAVASPVLSPRTVQPPRGLSDPEDWW